uniref:Uncharacterized protein n=1 Tax=Romanomermis culicivorax TaxID=13658 RepID=A0A915JVW6_ROMCU
MAEISDPDPDSIFLKFRIRTRTRSRYFIFQQASIADHCADCERYIGTQGGGMDQAVCLMAEAGR